MERGKDWLSELGKVAQLTTNVAIFLSEEVYGACDLCTGIFLFRVNVLLSRYSPLHVQIKDGVETAFCATQ